MDTHDDLIILRAASPMDLDTLERFQQGVIDAERQFDPMLREADVQYYDIAQMLANPELQLLVAAYGERPIACAFARVEPAKPWLKHAREAYLGMMFVEPDWRGRGVNARLIAALKEWCRAHGVTELRLDVYADNEPAVRAYRKAGFRASMVEMRVTLAE
jgi:GNAT superfamily N-acetyltransferase